MTEDDRSCWDSALFAKFAFALDNAQFDLLEEVFVEDATFTATVGGQVQVAPVQGRAAVIDFVSTAIRRHRERHRHMITNVYAQSEDIVFANLIVLVIRERDFAMESCGVYRVEMDTGGPSRRFRKLLLAYDLAPTRVPPAGSSTQS